MSKRLLLICLLLSIGFVGATAGVPRAAESLEAPRTTGKIFIGPLGIYVAFFTGEKNVVPKAIVPFISGKEAPDLTQAEAEALAIQNASIVAWDAWMRCLEAREKAKTGEMSEEEANLICADAREKNAVLDVVTAQTMLSENAFTDRQEWEAKLSAAEQALLALAQEPGFEAFVDVLERDLSGNPQTLVPVETSWETLQRREELVISPSGATAEGVQ